MEKVIRQKIIEFIKNNMFFSNKQHGFLSGRSTTLQLLTLMDKWTDVMDNGLGIDCIFFRFSEGLWQDTSPETNK